MFLKIYFFTLSAVVALKVMCKARLQQCFCQARFQKRSARHDPKSKEPAR